MGIKLRNDIVVVSGIKCHKLEEEKKSRKKNFLSYLFFCCASRKSDTTYAPQKFTSDFKPKDDAYHNNATNKHFEQDRTPMNFDKHHPTRPLPPSYNQNGEINKSVRSSNSNNDIKKQLFENAKIDYDGSTQYFKDRPPRGSIPSNPGGNFPRTVPTGSCRFDVGSNRRPSNHNISKEIDEKLDKVISIFTNPVLYQVYDEQFKRSERRRTRHRIRASLRAALHRRKGVSENIAPSETPAHVKRLLNEESENSSGDENGECDHIQNSKESKSTFNFIRGSDRNRSGIIRIAKDGEMGQVATKLAGSGPARTRWGDMPEVVERNLAVGLDKHQRNLLESRFEILSSEASYFKSLNVLITFFYKAPLFDPSSSTAVVQPHEKHHLFSNILDIHATSENLLHSLEMLYRKDPMMEEICDILYDHSENKLSVYITYVTNQMYQVRTLEKLMTKPAFVDAVQKITNLSQCNFLDLNSFLVLPLQRVIRLRLLVAAALHYTSKSSPAYNSGLVALASLEKLIQECDSKKTYMEQKERMIELSKQLEYKSTVKAVNFANRELVKEGNLKLFASTNSQPGAFKRKLSDVIKNKPTIATLLLFTDILLIAKQKGDKMFVEEISKMCDFSLSVDYTPEGSTIKRSEFKTKIDTDNPYSIAPNIRPERPVSRTRVSTTPSREHSRSRSHTRANVNGNNLFSFIITMRTDEKTIKDYHFIADSLNERERWIDVLEKGYYSVPPEISYDTWDCPQVMAINSFGASQLDELDLKEGDLLNVIVELSDGWIKGILPNGKSGWIPKQVGAEVDDPQARRQNMKNFLLSEEAQSAYRGKKLREKQSTFVRVNTFSTPI